MKAFQKGFVVPLILIIIALLAIGGGAYYYVRKNLYPQASTPAGENQQNQTVPNGVSAGSSMGTTSINNETTVVNNGTTTNKIIQPVGNAGNYSLVITLQDFVSQQPIAGVKLTVSEIISCQRYPQPATEQYLGAECPQPLKFDATTDANGKAAFGLPNSKFSLDSFEVNNYLQFPLSLTGGYSSSVFEDCVKSLYFIIMNNRCTAVSTETVSQDEKTKTILIRVIPKSLIKIKTQEQAVATARQISEIQSWLAGHSVADVKATEGNGIWEVGWSVGGRLKRLVWINALDGYAVVEGRWSD